MSATPHKRDARAHIGWRYNTAVPEVTSPPQPDQPPSPRPGKYHIFKLEAAGLLIIGVMILILTLIRYWHHIAWNAR